MILKILVNRNGKDLIFIKKSLFDKNNEFQIYPKIDFDSTSELVDHITNKFIFTSVFFGLLLYFRFRYKNN